MDHERQRLRDRGLHRLLHAADRRRNRYEEGRRPARLREAQESFRRVKEKSKGTAEISAVPSFILKHPTVIDFHQIPKTNLCGTLDDTKGRTIRGCSLERCSWSWSSRQRWSIHLQCQYQNTYIRQRAFHSCGTGWHH